MGKVLIYQSLPEDYQTIANYFRKKKDLVFQGENLEHVHEILSKHRPSLVFIDMHLKDSTSFSELINHIKEFYPETHIIITNKYPDLRQELKAKSLGAQVFLRYPFAPAWIQSAIEKVEQSQFIGEDNLPAQIPSVRVPMQVKIALPYALLALLFAIAFGLLVSRYVLETLQERLTNQLIDSGTRAADWMVQEEDRLLTTLRLIANTEDVSDAIIAENSEKLRELILPIMVNSSEQVIEILDTDGVSLLSIRQNSDKNMIDFTYSKGSTTFSELEFVKKIRLRAVDGIGDKYSGLFGDELFFVSGPVYSRKGDFVGIVLVGTYLSSLAEKMRENSLANITLFTPEGDVLVSTLFSQDATGISLGELAPIVASAQDTTSKIRTVQIENSIYSEILQPWEIRHGDDIGIIGATLIQNFIFRPSSLTRWRSLSLVLLAFVSVFLLGIILSRRFTQRLSKVVVASSEVAKGNLEIRVPPTGDDEVTVMAYAFNYMITGLQEGSIYRDLLGRTVSPEVRDALRQSFEKGELKLEGQKTLATVLLSDIRGFTNLAEREEPTTILHWLNEYFGALVPLVTTRNGVVDKFEGDALLAFFGILPKPLSPQESAYQACKVAVDMLNELNSLNALRIRRSEPELITGISINTGLVMAGGLGTADRLNYTVIGDAVNTTQRMQDATRPFGESGVVISGETYNALGTYRDDFKILPLGESTFKGKSDSIYLYRILLTTNDKL